MSNAIITLEFLAETALSDALQEAKDKADKFDVACIHFNFNGIRFDISKETNIEDIFNRYNKV